MSKKKQQIPVRTITTGHVEADMLGHCMIISEEISDKQNNPQRPHSKGMIVSKLKRVLKWFQTAPTACWRRLNVLISKGKSAGRSLLSRVRKQKRNGN